MDLSTKIVLLAVLLCIGLGVAFWAFALLRRPPRESTGIRPFVLRRGAYTDFLNKRLAGDSGAWLNDVQLEMPAPALSGAGERRRANGRVSSSSGTAEMSQEIAAQTLIAGGIALESWQSVDPHVLAAFSQYTHEQINNVWDLAKVVDARDYDLSNADWVARFQGHVAEQQVAEHLQVAGHSVSFPTSPTQPGWDLHVDGAEHLNVKNYQDASHLSQHFVHYPDVPAVVPGDAANLPHDALNFNPGEHIDWSALPAHHGVIVDHALNQADAADSLHHAGGLVQAHGGNMPGIPDHAFPIATLLVSGYREGKLLLDGNTEAGRAAKNIALDVAGVAAGAKVGAVAGGIVGAHFAGVGALPGALIGGLIGSIGGKLGAGEVRKLPLRTAGGEYASASSEFSDKEDASARQHTTEWVATEHQVTNDLSSALEDIEANCVSYAGRVDAATEAALLVDHQKACATIEAAGALGFGYTERDQKGSLASFRVRAAEKRWASRASKLLQGWTKSAADTAILYDMVLCVPDTDHLMEARLEEVVTIRATAREKLLDVARETNTSVMTIRATATSVLQEEFQRLTKAHEKRMKAPYKKLQTAAEKLRDEMAKAGMDPPPLSA